MEMVKALTVEEYEKNGGTRERDELVAELNSKLEANGYARSGRNYPMYTWDMLVSVYHEFNRAGWVCTIDNVGFTVSEYRITVKKRS
jgi:hypothetical protein